MDSKFEEKKNKVKGIKKPNLSKKKVPVLLVKRGAILIKKEKYERKGSDWNV